MGFHRGSESKTPAWWAGGNHSTDFTCPESFTSWRDSADVKARWYAEWRVSSNGNSAEKTVFGLIIRAKDDYNGGDIVRIIDPMSKSPFRRCVIGKRNGLFCKASFETNCDADQIARVGGENISGWEIIFPDGEKWWE